MVGVRMLSGDNEDVPSTSDPFVVVARSGGGNESAGPRIARVRASARPLLSCRGE